MFIFIHTTKPHKIRPIKVPGNAFQIWYHWRKKKMKNTNYSYFRIITTRELQINIQNMNVFRINEK
jgi:hypothetical protein